MTVHAWYNLTEAAFWAIFGLFCLTRALRSSTGRDRMVVTCITLLVFGLSDLVEIQTGAWWRPWWLLLWKATCLGVLALTWGPYLRRRV
jgi:hypothetical protein